MTKDHEDHLQSHREYFREVVTNIHHIANERLGLTQVSVHPLGSGGSRLSIPVKIKGLDGHGQAVKLFGKILGNADIMTARTIQTVKNLYLQMNARDAMFDFARDTKDMALHQYSTMKAIYNLGIPTAKPLGCFQINDVLWLLVCEFLEAKPVTDIGHMSLEQMDEVLGWLRLMHKNKIYHGDIKPDNVMLGDGKLYMLDVGRYLEDAPPSQKQAYDLACQIASFLPFQPAEEIVKVARKHYTKEEMRAASEYLDLIQKRMDLKFNDEVKAELLRLMK
jgi:tRNA A-37 threonylcarbamoyl transferase component Bud32